MLINAQREDWRFVARKLPKMVGLVTLGAQNQNKEKRGLEQREVCKTKVL